MVQKDNRLREIDFLRGIAILLVFFRHKNFFSYLTKMGWIGVDLFFVISGFLVSGLLFKEYKKYRSVNVKLFLIRRGFKIYPIYYLSYILYLFFKLKTGNLNFKYLLADLFFVQNYVHGYGYTYVASWSLAIEEHFYFGLTLLLGYIFNHKKSVNLQKMILVIISIIFLIRIGSNLFLHDIVRNHTMTHLRLDSLFAGVLISYWFYFKKKWLENIFYSNVKKLLAIAFLFLLFTPFYDFKDSIYVRTIGYTMLYISFGIILLYFLLQHNINAIIDKLFSKKIVNVISKIGYCSYSIYITHLTQKTISKNIF
jgi:peptidoglycan/LPS O-acetylase OafA/YrhL